MERKAKAEIDRRDQIMALRALMLNKKLSEKKKALDAVREQIAGFEAREAELAQAIEEAETDEEKAAVEEAVTQFEAEKEAAQNEAESLEAEVRELEEDLAKIETPAPEAAADERGADHAPEIRTKETKIMKRFKEMAISERAALVQREDVQGLLKTIRSAMAEKRTISNAGYLIPTVILDLLRENIQEWSKLYGRVRLRPVAGEGRQVIQGAIPEAVWTEACANLNELDLSFSKVEVDGYKVGGYFRICNASLEDSDEDLMAILLEDLGAAIGLALDKAILYGTGTKMPVGVLTALDAVPNKPNIVTHAATVTGAALIKALVLDSALIKGKYSRGEKLWCMNDKTYTEILAEALSTDATGAYVSMVNGRMPVIGGDIIVLDFIPDDVIIGGYFDLYLLAERAGTKISTSEEAFWVEDQTGFKGTARYDGKVLINNAFVAIGINGETPDPDDVTFAQDGANL